MAERGEHQWEVPQAFIVLKPVLGPEDVADIQMFITEKIGKWTYPRWIEIIDELPKTATGKIQRFKLRARA